MSAPLIERRIRLAGMVIALGLVIELVTFIWIHPLAFMAFLLISCPLLAIGIAVYLYSLVARQTSPSPGEPHGPM